MNKPLNFFLSSVVFCLMLGSQFSCLNIVKAAQNNVSINYQTQVQNIGWQKTVEMGQEAGTTSKALRMESLNINLENPVAGMQIQYQLYVEGIGWQKWVSNGQSAGTIGQSLKVEAIRIKIVGVSGYHVQYQVHVQSIGWMPVVGDGDLAGTSGQSKRIEAIKINIIKDAISLNYNAHVQYIGWQNQVNEWDTAGTTGQNLSIEAIKVTLNNAIEGMQVEYQTYVENPGWQNWTNNGQISGTTGKSLKVEGLKINLKNMPEYHVQYQVHVKNIGWMPWVSDGDIAGAVGQSAQIEALRVRIIKEQPQVLGQLLFIDKPQNSSTINDNQDLSISGRDLNKYGNKEIDVYADGMFISKAAIINQQYSYLIRARTLSSGNHTITMQAIGNNQTIEANKISVNINKLQPKMCIDTPIANTVVNDFIDIKGWALDSLGVSNIKIFVDGRYTNDATIGLARADVNTAYPNYINGINSGYSYTLDTSKLTLGSHSIIVQVLGCDGVVNKSSVIILKQNNGTMQVSSQLVGFSANYEGYSATSYRGVDLQNSTIGYGHVIQGGETYTSLSKIDALALLKKDLQGHVASVNSFTNGVNISQQQFDALVDFAYNCGDTALMQSTLLRYIKAGASLAEIKAQFQAWVYCNSVKYTGLYRRRTDEWDIYAYGNYTRNYISAPTGYK